MKNEQIPELDTKVKQPPVLFTKTQALIARLACRRRSKSDPPRRSNIDPGMDADRVMVGCGQV